MQSTPSGLAVSLPISPQPVSPQSLAAAFAAVPDPRRTASVQYPVAAVLALAVAALLANHRSVLAIAEWGARQDPILLTALGFPTARTPCQSTVQRLFRRLDGDALAATLSAHITPVVPPTGEIQGVAIDGKAQCGRLRFTPTGCPVHALSAFCHTTGLVLAHEPIVADGEKAEAELSVAPRLLRRLDWHQRVLTGDALFCQRELCQQVRDAGGDYLLLVKDNQPTIHDAIALLFDPPADLAVLPLLDRREIETIERGHGRSDEHRRLTASTDLTAYLTTELTWPGIAQVFRLERTWRVGTAQHTARHYGITSLTPAHANAAQLLALRRGHWTIENQLHRQKDLAFGEDASLIHCGQGPTVLALLRDGALNLLHQAGIRQIAARLRLHAQRPERAVALVVTPHSTRA